MPTAVSLFTGCGGSDFGLKAAGFHVVMANDILPYARDFYRANLDRSEYSLEDIRDIKAFPRADLLVGCYPCQGFSQGGARDPSRNINYLYREFDRALRLIKPKAFIVENVSGMKRDDNSQLFNNQLTRFRLAGYRVNAQVLTATDFGVPQERKRLFFVGLRSDLGLSYQFPDPTHSLNGLVGKKTPTIRDALTGLPDWPDGEYDTQPFHWYYMSRNRRRDWDDVSKTIVANSRHTPLHPISPQLTRIHTDLWKFAQEGPARRFSYREAAALQGFPSELIFPETYGVYMRYRVIGNAVPPPLFAAVANALPNVW